MSLEWFRNARKEDFDDILETFPNAISGIPKEFAGMTTTQLMQMDVIGVYFPNKETDKKG
jgi:hypothetical protein